MLGVTTIEEVGRQNMAMMERAFSMFTPFYRPSESSLPSEAVQSEIEALRAENEQLRKELEALSKQVDLDWVARAAAEFDTLHGRARRNVNRQLGLDAIAVSLEAASADAREARR